MTIEEIREKVLQLRDHYAQLPVPVHLRDKAMVVYCQRTLAGLDAVLRKPEGELVKALKDFLFTHWRFVNGTALSPTAIPEADITQLLVEISEFVAEEINQEQPESPVSAIALFMPTVTIESIRPKIYDEESNPIGEGYKNLDKMNLLEVLKTHILGREGLFLLPVRLLTELDLFSTATKLMNPYTPDDAGTALYTVDSEEYNRLLGHSHLTEAVADAKKQCDLLMRDTSTLLGQLTELCRALAANDVSGFGSERDAAGAAYAPIIAFRDYYTKGLTEAEINKIPSQVKVAIEKLLSVAFDPVANLDGLGGQNIDTCIATRGSKLKASMTGNEPVLASISVSGTQKQLLLNEATAHLKEAISALERDARTAVGGCDKMGLNHALLQALQIEFNISTLQDIEVFKALTAAEMTALLESPVLQQQLIHQLGHLENLVVMMIELSSEKITALLKSTGLMITQEFIHSSQDISALLISLEPEKCRIVCEALKDNFSTWIKEPKDVVIVLKHLNLEQATSVLDAMEGSLLDAIKTAEVFFKILKVLDGVACVAFCLRMKDQLLSWIKTGENFGFLLKELDPSQRTAIYEVMQDHLQGIITSAWDFNRVLWKLNPAQQAAVYEKMQHHLPSLIKNAGNFGRVLQYLNLEQSSNFLQVMKQQKTDVIKTAEDFNTVLNYLTEDQSVMIYETMKESLLDLIKTADDFNLVLEFFNANQRTLIYERMHGRLFDLLINEHDKELVQEHLTREQSEELLTLHLFIDKMKGSGPAKAFACALMENDHEKIKAGLMNVIKTGQSTASKAHFFGSSDDSIGYISNLDQEWIKRLNTVLGLGLEEGRSLRREAFELALKKYLSDEGFANQAGVGL